MTPREIQRLVASHAGISVEQLRCARQPRFSTWRQVAMYLVRVSLELSYPDIGRAFGRDHTTVLSAFRKISREVLANDSMRVTVATLRQRIEHPTGDQSLCTHCGQRIDRETVIGELRREAEKIQERIAILEQTEAL